MKISQSELMHLRMQAIMRETTFPDNELMYLGERAGHHWYLIAGEHEVKAEDIVDMEEQPLE